MESRLFEKYKGAELSEMLDSNADEVVEMEYTEFLSEEELAERKNLLAQRSIEESRLMDEKKAFNDEIKARIKPIKEEKDMILTEIKHGSRSLFGKCYKMVDHSKKEVGYYNGRGQLVYSRPAQANESQLTIMSINREGTND